MFLYQIVHTRAKENHAAVLNAASLRFFGRGFSGGFPPLKGDFVRLELYPDGTVRTVGEGGSLYGGYALRALRPVAVPVRYEPVGGDWPTSERLECEAWATLQAQQQGGHVALRVAGNRLRLCDGAPLLALTGKQIYSPPLPPSIEAGQARKLAAWAGLEWVEQDISLDRLPLFDELCYFDHRGLSSISACDGNVYTDILTQRMAGYLKNLYL